METPGNSTSKGSPRNVVILLGGPGAGKGTQAAAIADWFRIPHISTGQLLRSEAASNTELGLCAKAIMDAGALVGDDLVNELIARRISQKDCTSGFILDGYPRDIDQALNLKRTLSEADRLIVIDIAVSLEKVIPRLTGRRTCKSCNDVYHTVTSPPRRAGLCDHCGSVLVQRSDDREDVIRERFETYRVLTKPLTDLYQQWGVYNQVDGMQPRDVVAGAVRRLLDKEVLQISLSEDESTDHG
jgi:adenylate kinase